MRKKTWRKMKYDLLYNARQNAIKLFNDYTRIGFEVTINHKIFESNSSSQIQ